MLIWKDQLSSVFVWSPASSSQYIPDGVGVQALMGRFRQNRDHDLPLAVIEGHVDGILLHAHLFARRSHVLAIRLDSIPARHIIYA